MGHRATHRADEGVPSGSIVVLDFGGQYAHLIANRVRRLGAYSVIRDAQTPAANLRAAAGIILSGGPQSVYEKGSPQADRGIFELGIPVLGLCYGHQWIAHALGGEVRPGAVKEYGHARIERSSESPLFSDIPSSFTAWMSHGDEVARMPDGFSSLAKSPVCAVAVMADPKRQIYGIQFHIEVTHTEYGMEILKNFIGLCDHAPWNMTGFAARIGDEIREEVVDRNVFMLVSGGVDSTVAFTLLNRVLGSKRVRGLLVDTGLMRKGEIAQIEAAFEELGIDNLHVEDASAEFFTRLDGIVDPEEKRAVIGQTFLDVQARVSERMGLSVDAGWMLGQGTIYPDTIETGGTKHADQIKTHHNRVPAVQRMIDAGLVIEPLKELYKDEVRVLGEELGLPHDLVWRHPFPGPGLGVRILCAYSAVSTSASSDDIPLPHAILPVRSVGVQGDGRTYRHAVALFAHHPCRVTPEQMALATSIPNANHDINRVLLCTSATTPLDFIVTPSHITRERANLLREADAIVNDEMRAADLTNSVWQFPVVLLPCGTKKGMQSIVLRPIQSTDAMTANAVALPEDILTQITRRLLDLPGIDAVFLDLTHKPPATIEWE